MPMPDIIDVVKQDLYTPKEEMLEKYAEPQVEHVMRLREMVTWIIANPDAKDRQFVEEVKQRYKVSHVTAYADLKIVKSVMPNLAQNSREWRRNERTQKRWKRRLRRMRNTTASMSRMSWPCRTT